MAGKGTITYTYDAVGNKLRKQTVEGSKTTTTLYGGSVVYENDTLQFMSHEEGRTRINNNTNYVFDYYLKDHLGNVRMTITDDNAASSPVIDATSYYPFGLVMSGVSSKGMGKLENKFKYNGKELQGKEFIDGSGLEWLDYGARMYDNQVGRWHSLDKLANKYADASPYVYVLNRPTVAIDPDGKRVYFIGGAGNDKDGWNYINRWGSAFKNAGISNFIRVDASNGKLADMRFTNNYRSSGTELYSQGVNQNSYIGGLVPAPQYGERPVQNETIDKTVEYYQQQLKDKPLTEGEQFNMAGYSYGSVLQAQAALKLANGGQVIDNLVLIGSPISDKSDLMKQLKSNSNIKNVIRYDISGDKLSNPNDILQYLQGIQQSAPVIGKGDNAHHFDAARPGNAANQLIQTIITWLQKEGVKN